MATFYKEGKRLAKASCSQPISCTSESCSSWKPRDSTGLTLCKYPLSLGKHHTLKIAPIAQGQAGPEDRLSLAPTGHTPVRGPAFSCWMASGAPYLLDEGGGQGRTPPTG